MGADSRQGAPEDIAFADVLGALMRGQASGSKHRALPTNPFTMLHDRLHNLLRTHDSRVSTLTVFLG